MAKVCSKIVIFQGIWTQDALFTNISRFLWLEIQSPSRFQVTDLRPYIFWLALDDLSPKFRIQNMNIHLNSVSPQNVRCQDIDSNVIFLTNFTWKRKLIITTKAILHCRAQKWSFWYQNYHSNKNANFGSAHANTHTKARIRWGTETGNCKIFHSPNSDFIYKFSNTNFLITT